MPLLWYVAQTREYCEALAVAQLAKQGIRAVTLTIDETVLDRARPRRVKRPVIPEYVFVELDTSTDAGLWWDAAAARYEDAPPRPELGDPAWVFGVGLAHPILRAPPRRASRWRSVNGTRGIVHLLPVGVERPLSLPPGVVDDLLTRLSSGEFAPRGGADSPSLPRDLKEDDPVPVRLGPWAGHTGLLMLQPGPDGVPIAQHNGIVFLRMSLFGQMIPVPHPVENLL